MAAVYQEHRASFRDPSGFVFERDGVLYRHISEAYQPTWNALQASSLIDELIAERMLVPHVVVDDRTIKPERIPLISYPAEWSFSQYKDAALLTLRIATKALEKGFILKDATAYNIQFSQGAPIFIDTLSFDVYEEGRPWVAYQQFCKHFLAPLLLMSEVDIDCSKMMRDFIDGIPLPLVSKALPVRSWFSFSTLIHIHLHAKSQGKYADKGKVATTETKKISKHSLFALFDSLQTAVQSLSWKPAGTEWGDYYQHTNYSPDAMNEKEKLVYDFLQQCAPRNQIVWDMGANTGNFSLVAAQTATEVVSFDIDPAAVEKHYLSVKASGQKKVLPLVLDLTNPTPSYGWGERERDALSVRAHADVVMALALIHHISLSNNVPFKRVAEYFARLAPKLIIEFVPKQDSQVQKLLATREDVFPTYNEAGFEEGFGHLYEIEEKRQIPGTVRTLYRMTRRG
jgi:ribosomal protein L11 methylase PrmA